MRARGMSCALGALSGVGVFATVCGVAMGTIIAPGGAGAITTAAKTSGAASGGTAITADARRPRVRKHRVARKHARVRKHARKRQPAGVPEVASWYYDYGNTACGFHAEYGVANKTLPCGTHVTISYDGRTVDAVVDDRGPYVYGREYDLDQTVSRRLGMYGVATVRVTVN